MLIQCYWIGNAHFFWFAEVAFVNCTIHIRLKCAKRCTIFREVIAKPFSQNDTEFGCFKVISLFSFRLTFTHSLTLYPHSLARALSLSQFYPMLNMLFAVSIQFRRKHVQRVLHIIQIYAQKQSQRGKSAARAHWIACIHSICTRREINRRVLFIERFHCCDNLNCESLRVLA